MSEDNSSSVVAYPFIFTNSLKFWSLLIALIPALLCSLFTLYHFLFDRTLRTTLNNHVVIIVLFIGLFCQITNYPWMLYYYHANGLWQRPITFCLIWVFIDWTLYILQTILFAWAAIERHILIFHDNLVRIRKKRLLFHYLPIFILISYCFIYYIIVDFLISCENSYNDSYLCINLCVYNNPDYYMWEVIGHQCVPGFSIIIFSITLLGRVIHKKIRANQRVQWRKHRKMTIQMLSLSILYTLFYFPSTCFNFLSLSNPLYYQYVNTFDILNFISYFMMLFLPMVCMMTLPELGKRIKNTFRLRRRPPREIGVAPLTRR